MQLSYIGASLHQTAVQSWIINALSLVQAAFGPIIASASDTFQNRKLLLVGTSTVSFVGAAIAPGSKDVYRLIAAQILIGVGFAAVPLAYAVPSEILPRKWRPRKFDLFMSKPYELTRLKSRKLLPTLQHLWALSSDHCVLVLSQKPIRSTGGANFM